MARIEILIEMTHEEIVELGKKSHGWNIFSNRYDIRKLSSMVF